MPRKRNDCRMSWNYVISHKNAGEQHAKLRKQVADGAAEQRAKDDIEAERITELLRASTADIRPATRKDPTT